MGSSGSSRIFRSRRIFASSSNSSPSNSTPCANRDRPALGQQRSIDCAPAPRRLVRPTRTRASPAAARSGAKRAGSGSCSSSGSRRCPRARARGRRSPPARRAARVREPVGRDLSIRSHHRPLRPARARARRGADREQEQIDVGRRQRFRLASSTTSSPAPNGTTAPPTEPRRTLHALVPALGEQRERHPADRAGRADHAYACLATHCRGRASRRLAQPEPVVDRLHGALDLGARTTQETRIDDVEMISRLIRLGERVEHVAATRDGSSCRRRSRTPWRCPGP